MTFWTGSQKSVSSLGPWEPWVYFKNTTFIWWFWRCWRDCEFVGLSDINAEEVCYWAFLFRVFANNLQESSFTTKIMFLTKSDHFIQKNWESKVAHAFLHQPKPLLVCLCLCYLVLDWCTTPLALETGRGFPGDLKKNRGMYWSIMVFQYNFISFI